MSQAPVFMDETFGAFCLGPEQEVLGVKLTREISTKRDRYSSTLNVVYLA